MSGEVAGNFLFLLLPFRLIHFRLLPFRVLYFFFGGGGGGGFEEGIKVNGIQ